MLPALAGNPAKHDALVSASEPVRRLDAVGRYDCPALMPQFPENCQLRRIVDLAFLRVNDDADAPSPLANIALARQAQGRAASHVDTADRRQSAALKRVFQAPHDRADVRLEDYVWPLLAPRWVQRR